MTVKCQCCLSTGDLVKLTEKYTQMLMYCFRIEFPPKQFICNSCVEKVKETSAFRYLILISQSKLKECSSSTISNVHVKLESNTSIVKTEPSYESDEEKSGNDRDNKLTQYDIIYEKLENVKTYKEADHNLISKQEPSITEDTFSLYNNTTDKFVWPKNNLNVQINKKVESNTPILEFEIPIKKQLKQNIEKSSIKKGKSPKLKSVRLIKKNIKFDSKKSSIEKNKLLEEISSVQTNIKDEYKPDLCIKEIIAPDNDFASNSDFIESLSDEKINNIIPKKTKTDKHPPFKLDRTSLTCELCKETFITNVLLLRHMSVHYPNYVCPECGKVFVRRSNLCTHMKSHDELQVSCTVCDKKMKHTTLPMHMKIHSTNSDRKRYPCSHCSERFISFYTRQRHIIDVHNVDVRRYQCKLCPKKFSLASSMKVHVRRDHNKEMTVFCGVCNKGFFSKFKLKIHMPKHTGEKNFTCHVCSKKFSARNALTTHLKSHPEVDKHSCSYCDKVYFQLKSLTAHLKTHENVNNE